MVSVFLPWRRRVPKQVRKINESLRLRRLVSHTKTIVSKLVRNKKKSAAGLIVAALLTTGGWGAYNWLSNRKLSSSFEGRVKNAGQIAQKVSKKFGVSLSAGNALLIKNELAVLSLQKTNFSNLFSLLENSEFIKINDSRVLTDPMDFFGSVNQAQARLAYLQTVLPLASVHTKALQLSNTLSSISRSCFSASTNSSISLIVLENNAVDAIRRSGASIDFLSALTAKSVEARRRREAVLLDWGAYFELAARNSALLNQDAQKLTLGLSLSEREKLFRTVSKAFFEPKTFEVDFEEVVKKNSLRR